MDKKGETCYARNSERESSTVKSRRKQQKDRGAIHIVSNNFKIVRFVLRVETNGVENRDHQGEER